ncbi:MAG: metal-dependent hydrolase [Candidatus Bathyarchaeota archaeon]|nr:metal-dependent hydrolase [Candidatus Bathyarchaeota archaeon]
MFAIGHFALGYLTGKASSKILDVKINLPLILTLSVIPDTDLILQYLDPLLFMHRGPTHSLITSTVIFLPFLFYYRKRALPYYAALLSHAFADFFTGGLELLWPLSTTWFGLIDVDLRALVPALTELFLFVVAVIIMFKLKDLQTLLKPGNCNLLLIVAFMAVLGPLVEVGGNSGLFPVLLVVPSLFCLALFGYSMAVELYAKLRCLGSSMRG